MKSFRARELYGPGPIKCPVRVPSINSRVNGSAGRIRQFSRPAQAWPSAVMPTAGSVSRVSEIFDTSSKEKEKGDSPFPPRPTGAAADFHGFPANGFPSSPVCPAGTDWPGPASWGRAIRLETRANYFLVETSRAPARRHRAAVAADFPSTTVADSSIDKIKTRYTSSRSAHGRNRYRRARPKKNPTMISPPGAAREWPASPPCPLGDERRGARGASG